MPVGRLDLEDIGALLRPHEAAVAAVRHFLDAGQGTRPEVRKGGIEGMRRPEGQAQRQVAAREELASHLARRQTDGRDELRPQPRLAHAEHRGGRPHAPPRAEELQGASECALVSGAGGGGVRPAAQAGAQPVRASGLEATVEAHALRLRHSGRTARQAVDPGGANPDQEPPVEAPIPTGRCPPAGLEVVVHPARIAAPGRRG